MNITFDQSLNAWHIKAPAHVILPMKRYFASMGKARKDTYTLSNSPNACQDLAMFADRFGLEMREEDRHRLMSTVTFARRKEEETRNIIAGKTPHAAYEAMVIQPRDYQKVAAELAYSSGSLLVGDELGLGKTIVGISFLTKPGVLPAVIVAKPHLVLQWQAEIKRFFPKLRVHVVKKTEFYDYTRRLSSNRSQSTLWVDDDLNPSGMDVLLITYHKLHGWVDHFIDAGFNTVIYDECHEGRRTGTTRYDAMKALSGAMRYRIGLSATPIFNYGDEYYNVFECIAPGRLGTYQEFSSEWGKGNDVAGRLILREPKAFGSWLKSQGIFIRRTLKDVGMELPPVNVIAHHIDADLNKLRDLSSSCAELARTILNLNGLGNLQKVSGISAARFDSLLRQATGIAKAPFVAQFVNMLIESGCKKVLLGGWHREVYAIWQEILKEHMPVMYTGTETTVEKERARMSFVKGESKVLIMSLRSGEGLNGLNEVCNTVVNGELDWSFAVHKQLLGRLHRPGQKQPIFSYFMIAEHGADPAIADVLQVKKHQLHGVIGIDEKAEPKELDPEYIKKLASQYLKTYQGVAA